MEHDPVQTNITAPYISSVIADLKINSHPFYTLFIHAPLCMVSINLAYDFRTNRGCGENDPDPLCSFSVPDFMQRANRFHKYDCFMVTLNESFVVGTEDHFTADTVESFYTEFLRRECRRGLMAHRLLTLSDRYVELCRLSRLEYIEITAVFTQLHEQIIGEQKALDHLTANSHDKTR